MEEDPAFDHESRTIRDWFRITLHFKPKTLSTMAERPNPFSISVGILIALQSDPTSPLHQELNPSGEVQQRLSSFLQESILKTRDGWSSVQAPSLVRFFAGLTHEEAGRILGVSAITARRCWRYARAWLHRELFGG